MSPVNSPTGSSRQDDFWNESFWGDRFWDEPTSQDQSPDPHDRTPDSRHGATKEVPVTNIGKNKHPERNPLKLLMPSHKADKSSAPDTDTSTPVASAVIPSKVEEPERRKQPKPASKKPTADKPKVAYASKSSQRTTPPRPKKTSWGRAMALAWKDPANGKFTRRIIMLSPLCIVDDALVFTPLTPITSADTVAMLIGFAIYAGKVRKYHK